MDNIRILIVDDHPMMREALVAAFADEPDLQVAGEAANGPDGLALAAELKPDVILMDLLMPGMDGLEAIQQIFNTSPEAKILVLTSMEDEARILASIQAGALGYFPKTAPRSYLLEAIRKVADGVPYLPSGITLKLFNSLRALKSSEPLSAVHEPITVRQKEILALLGEGHTDQEIGKILHLGEATVRSHVHNILLRLGLESRTQAVAYLNRQHKVE
jgi:two-component system, NarL family, response regulator LiaR